MKLLRIYLGALLGAVVVFSFYHFGRPLWYPWKTCLLGGRTIEQVLAATQVKVADRFPNLSELTNGEPLALLAFKEEGRLEVWKQSSKLWTQVCTHPFTGNSGVLGPTLREGDRQIPEGIYQVEGLNPNSSYHLSIKVDYPNAFDRQQAAVDGRDELGGNIFIHGENVTIGCIPIGNDAVEEVFHLVGANGYENNIVILAPFDMRRVPERVLEVEAVTWEGALYAQLRQALQDFQPVAATSSR